MNCGTKMNSEIASLQSGAVVVIDLDRICAATVAQALPTRLQQWAKSPDVYALVLKRSSTAEGPPAPERSSAEAADLLKCIWRLDCFPKPLVSLLDAPLTPLDIGLTTLATHRVAAESYRLALPLPSDLASLPAAGMAHALARLPDGLGVDLALSGRAIGSAEAYAVGLATHCINSSAFARIIAALADGQPVDPLLDGLNEEPTHSAAGHATMNCEAPSGAIADAMRRLIAEARAMDVRESLIATYRFAVHRRALQGGTRADIDLAERPPAGDLPLPLRADIESGRF